MPRWALYQRRLLATISLLNWSQLLDNTPSIGRNRHLLTILDPTEGSTALVDPFDTPVGARRGYPLRAPWDQLAYFLKLRF
jgi:hypothetical protein